MSDVIREIRSPLSLVSSFAGESLLNALKTLSRIRARSLKAIKWLHACSPYRNTPLITANIHTATKAAVLDTGTEKPSTSSIAKPPKTVIKAAHRCPASPIKIAADIYPDKGFTRPESLIIIEILLRFFILRSLPFRSFRDSAEHSTFFHKRRDF